MRASDSRDDETTASFAEARALEPGAETRRALAAQVFEFVEHFIGERGSAPARSPPMDPALLAALMLPPPEHGGPLDALLERVNAAADTGFDTASGKHLSFIPSGGLHSAALASYIAAAMNRYTGGSFASPGSIAIEQSIIRWLASLLGFPDQAAGVLLSGGSLANFTATVVARSRFGDDFRTGTLYVCERAHHSVEKAARLAGIAADRIRRIPADDALRMDVIALREQLRRDVRLGLQPMMVNATAGTTDTGSIDPLLACADVAREFSAWFHVDAAYGGFFVLTERGRQLMQGIERADSVTVDAHKSLFLPFGVGGLIVRDGDALVTAHAGRGAYMQDVVDADELPHYFALGPELTRPFRGLAMWLPLHLHGVNAFAAELDRMLDLARSASDEIAGVPGLQLCVEPSLSIASFCSTRGDQATRALLEYLNKSGLVHVSSTTARGRLIVRLAFLSQRTTHRVVDDVLRLLRDWQAQRN